MTFPASIHRFLTSLAPSRLIHAVSTAREEAARIAEVLPAPDSPEEAVIRAEAIRKLSLIHI